MGIELHVCDSAAHLMSTPDQLDSKTPPAEWSGARAMKWHRRGCHAPTHIGPTRFFEGSQRPDEEPVSPSLFRRDLQAAERDGGGRLRHPAHAGRDRRTAQRLLPRPESFRDAAGTNQDDPLQRDAPPGQGRGGKLPFAINDDEDRALARSQRLGRGEEGEGETSAGRFREPFSEPAAREASLRKELIERRDAAGAGSFRVRTAGGSPLELVGQGRQGGGTCHGS
jgi:hypothetical protein